MTSSPIFALADVAEIASGITLGRKTKETDLVDVPYLRVANVQDGHLSVDHLKTVPASRREIQKWALRDGDLLLTEGGDLDKLGRGACWREQVPLCIHQNHIFRVRFQSDRYDPDFVSFQMGSPYGKAYFLSHAKKTTGIASINQRVLGRFPLISPPLAEQRRVADRIKALLTEVDTTVRAAKTQLGEAQLLRRSIQLRAFEGLLNDHERDVTLDEVCTISAGGTPARGNHAFFNGDIPWVKTLDLNLGLVVKTQEKITAAALRSIRGEMLPMGTVLVAMYGGAGTIGKSGLLGIEACTNQAICALQPDRKLLSPEFLHAWISFVRPEWMRYSGGNRKDPNISKSIVEGMTLPLPSLAVQREFVKGLEAQLLAAETMLTGAIEQLQQVKKLPQRILSDAFAN
jgi:type I restriction enzyme, S subunit